MSSGSPFDRAMRRVEKDPDTGCWNWTGPLRKDGSGQLWVNRGHRLAYRVVFEHLVGPIPVRLVLDHLCRNRRCVNPDHLEPVEQAENTRRGLAAEAARAMFDALWANRTHCANGHALAEVGLIVRQSGSYTTRQCAGCRKEQKASAYLREIADPDKLASRRARNRLAVAAYRARLKENAS